MGKRVGAELLGALVGIADGCGVGLPARYVGLLVGIWAGLFVSGFVDDGVGFPL